MKFVTVVVKVLPFMVIALAAVERAVATLTFLPQGLAVLTRLASARLAVPATLTAGLIIA